MTIDFEATWVGTELGDYRPCSGTYERYPYSSLPKLDDARFVGDFDWLPDQGTIDPVEVSRIAGLDRQLGALGLALPADFVRFHTYTNLSLMFIAVSGTGCWTTLTGPERDGDDDPLDMRNYPIPSPVEPGAYLIRFLIDQQDCVTWYLYLRLSGETFVVHAYGLEFEVDDDGTPAYLRPGTLPHYLRPSEYALFAKIFWCAPTFEQFAYRFWIENRILETSVDDHKAELAPDLDAYLDHYRRVNETP